LDAVKAFFRENTDQYIRSMIRQVYFWADDVEDLYIRALENGQQRTAAQEMKIVAFAESHLDNTVLPRVRELQGLTKCGGNAMSFGG
jgi:hypothetical protein